MEPSGAAGIKNLDTGEYCEMDYKARGAWNTAEADKLFLTGEVKDKNG
jgi:hypothetical protein